MGECTNVRNKKIKLQVAREIQKVERPGRPCFRWSDVVGQTAFKDIELVDFGRRMGLFGVLC